MTLEEARKLLNLADHFTRKEVDAAFSGALNRLRAKTRVDRKIRDSFSSYSKALSNAKKVCLDALVAPPLNTRSFHQPKRPPLSTQQQAPSNARSFHQPKRPPVSTPHTPYSKSQYFQQPKRPPQPTPRPTSHPSQWASRSRSVFSSAKSWCRSTATMLSNAVSAFFAWVFFVLKVMLLLLIIVLLAVLAWAYLPQRMEGVWEKIQDYTLTSSQETSQSRNTSPRPRIQPRPTPTPRPVREVWSGPSRITRPIKKRQLIYRHDIAALNPTPSPSRGMRKFDHRARPR